MLQQENREWKRFYKRLKRKQYMNKTYVAYSRTPGRCTECGAVRELREGICFDCATQGEAIAAKRTVLQHIAKALHNIRHGNLEYARYDISWAWERLTRTGDYKQGGYFDREGHQWR